MARPSKYDHHKPAVKRLVREGLSVSKIKEQFPSIPNGTIYRWFNAFKEKIALEYRGELGGFPNNPESIPQARVRLAAIDPDSPLDKITRALWEIVENPQPGDGTKVQALNSLLKIVQWNHDQAISQDDDEAEVLPVDITVESGAETAS